MKKTLFSALLLTLSLSANAQLADIEMVSGSYEANTSSLGQWECPEWFQDAKFGLWAHWGPQCQANSGDWFGRYMYGGETYYDYERGASFKSSEYGFKEFCRDWKADKWDPEAIIAKYEKVGAKYFLALANHHDNFDCWDSPYQEWNSVNMGPKRDLGGEWAAAARRHGMKFGMSVHAAHAWTWFEIGRKYGDVRLTKADGVGKWWEGYDPNELYAQAHETVSSGWDNMGNIHNQWNWGNGASIPDAAYKTKLQNRCRQMVNALKPDLVYFDDTVLPFYGCDNQWGQDFLAYYYNYMEAQGTDVVCCGKVLGDEHKEYMLWDVERGIPDRPQKKPWQTDTCIGGWHYSLPDYWNGAYKSAATVIRMLIDIVSKNGNLALSVPLRGDGSYDEKEAAILDGIQHWMEINGESIYGTRVWWDCFGEGPLAEATNGLNGQGFNEGQSYSNEDVRYVTKGDVIYATIMAWPNAGNFTMKAFSTLDTKVSKKVSKVTLLGYGEVEYTHGVQGLVINVPSTHPDEIAPAFRVEFSDNEITYNDIVSDFESVANSAMLQTSRLNSGKYNVEKVEALQAAVAAAKTVDTSDAEAVAAAKIALNDAYKTFVATGKNRDGIWSDTYEQNLTTQVLKETTTFARSEGGTSRFGKPANWTVENYKLPDGDTPANGTRQGLDKEQGRDMLMLGVWNDRAGNQSGDISNARIYRKAKLQAGVYFFGANFEDIYQVSNQAYMFVSKELVNTSELVEKSLATYQINKAAENSLSGLWVELTEETEVYIGFQANLNAGSATQQMRAQEVVFYSIDPTSIQTPSERLISKGWTKVEALDGIDYAQNFFALSDHNNENLAVVARGADNTKNWGNTYAMFYSEGASANQDKAALWIVDAFDSKDTPMVTGNEAANFIFSSPLEQARHFRTEGWNSTLWQTYSDFKASKNTNESNNHIAYCTPEYSATTGWTFYRETSKAYIGPWDNKFENGAEFAANKTGDNVGHFDMYTISRGKWMQQYEKLSTASAAAPVDITYVITNPDFERFDGNLLPIGWNIDGDVSDCYAENSNWLPSHTGHIFLNSWNNSGSPLGDRSFSQTIKDLPAGTYRLQVYCLAPGEGATLYANNNVAEIAASSSAGDVTLEFKLETEQDVELGVRLETYTNREFRMDNIRLAVIGSDAPISYEELQSLIETVEEASKNVAYGSGTGYYDPAIGTALTEALEAAQNVAIGKDNYKTEFDALNGAYAALAAGPREGTLPPTDNVKADLTIYDLHESDHFARKDPNNTNRFTAAKYWIVDNYDGVNRGLDKDKGYDCLGMEIWWDIANYSGYDLANARIYQKMTLPEGKYYFGACYPIYEPNDEQYIFASTSLLKTSDIPTQSLAFEAVKKAKYNDNNSTEFRGLTFTLTEPSDVYLGWQANMSQNGAYNVRVKGVKLLALGETAVSEVRQTAKGLFGTICLPTAADVEGATLYTAELSDDGKSVILTEATSLEAGVPYVYQATADKQLFTLKGDTEKTPGTNVLTGNFEETLLPVGSYVLQNQNDVQKFYVVAADNQPTLSRFKAYLPSNGSSVKELSILFAGATAIESLTEGTEQPSIYDLQGRKRTRLTKGVNIVNGQSVLVK